VSAPELKTGAEAIAEKGWLAAHKWLLLRRITQVGILLAFLVGPWFGMWIVKGNLNFSYTLDVLPLTDPYMLLQSLLGGRLPETLAWVGVAIVLGVYMLVGGRVYCSWVCPVNPVTDLASWLRRALGIKGGIRLSETTRYWVLGMTLVVALLTGTIAWEMFNPVSMLHRGLIFGMGFAWVIVLAVFLFDLFLAQRGWCGHVCPVGAFYSLVGKASVVRVVLPHREACNNCMDCYAVCPEFKIIKPALKAVGGAAPIILDATCTNCGRCIDVCSKHVFAFGTRFTIPVSHQPAAASPVADGVKSS
jgi:ferredoxin-type protein NapH